LTDRLIAIKKHGPHHRVGDAEWLIDEVERLRNALREAVIALTDVPARNDDFVSGLREALPQEER
jgi:hypothetical protein